MGSKKISPEVIEETIHFHGHSCPGLAIGIRVAEVALQEFERAPDEEIVAVVETDMCAVDAVQYLTGCTFGKGNLIHLDYGKNAFTFYRRSDEKGIRVVTRPRVFEEPDGGMLELMAKRTKGGELTPEEEHRLNSLREARIRMIMEADPHELFEVKEVEGPLPQRARILQGLICDACKERTMESRTRRLDGRVLCIPCFEREEKRL